jgi:hypothetical protein
VGIRKAHTDSSYGGILLRRHTRRDDTRPFAQHDLIAATLVFDLSIIRGYSTVFVARGISNTNFLVSRDPRSLCIVALYAWLAVKEGMNSDVFHHFALHLLAHLRLQNNIRTTVTAPATAAGMSSQRNQSDSFRFKRAAFYHSLKSKVGLAAAKAAALRININVDRWLWHSSRPSARSFTRSPSSPPPSFTQSLFPPRSLVRDGQTSPHRSRLVVSRSTCEDLHYPPPPTRTALSQVLQYY